MADRALGTGAHGDIEHPGPTVNPGVVTPPAAMEAPQTGHSEGNPPAENEAGHEGTPDLEEKD